MPAITRQQRNFELAEKHAKLLVQFARETGDIPLEKPVSAAALPGDEEALRGIPAIGRSVAGVIRGTAPGSNL